MDEVEKAREKYDASERCRPARTRRDELLDRAGQQVPFAVPAGHCPRSPGHGSECGSSRSGAVRDEGQSARRAGAGWDPTVDPQADTSLARGVLPFRQLELVFLVPHQGAAPGSVRISKRSLSSGSGPLRGPLVNTSDSVQVTRAGTAGPHDSGKTAKACPSALCEEGALLLGVVAPDGHVAYIQPPSRVSAEFVAQARALGHSERRFRFSSTCVEAACPQWTGRGCALSLRSSRRRVTLRPGSLRRRPCLPALSAIPAAGMRSAGPPPVRSARK